MKLAESVCNLGEAEFSKKDLQEEHNKLDKLIQEEGKKFKVEMEDYEQQIVQTSLSLAMAQAEIEDLKRQIRNK
jgi:hypothetical protein